MRHERTYAGYTPRNRLLARAELRHSRLSTVKRLYFVKNVRYGTYCDSTEYNKIQITHTQNRIDFAKGKKGTKSVRSLWRAREKVYQLVESNIRRTPKAIFFTLTSKDQEKDLRQSNRKIKALMRRIKKFIGQSPKYLIVPELHVSGAIHYHGVFFNVPFIHVKQFRFELWKEGYVDLQLPKKIKSVSRYLAKYLTKDTLCNIPKNEKVYFCSRHLARPQVDYTNQKPDDTIKTLEVIPKNNGVKVKYLCKNKSSFL